jgi:Ca2+-binding RTX toxin-like protein
MKKPIPLSLDMLGTVVGGQSGLTFTSPDGGVTLGTAGDDHIQGYGGHDTIDAGAGNDVVHAGDGVDLVIWRPDGGNDLVNGGEGQDVLSIEAYGLTPDQVLAAFSVAPGEPAPIYNPQTGLFDVTGVTGSVTIDGAVLHFSNFETLFIPMVR